jgi:hypothetical protein
MALDHITGGAVLEIGLTEIPAPGLPRECAVRFAGGRQRRLGSGRNRPN